jgi:hypothetical protein
VAATGVANVALVQADSRALLPFTDRFDCVNVDAPCPFLGRFGAIPTSAGTGTRKIAGAAAPSWDAAPRRGRGRARRQARLRNLLARTE